jgi:photoactive yellow protein
LDAWTSLAGESNPVPAAVRILPVMKQFPSSAFGSAAVRRSPTESIKLSPGGTEPQYWTGPPLDVERRRPCLSGILMSLETTTRMLAPFLDRLTDEELDAIPYGVVQLNAEGSVLSFNLPEARELGWSTERPIGLDFFNDVAPSAFVAEVYGRFVNAFAAHQLDDMFRFTYEHLYMPRTVLMRMYFSARTGTLWIFTANPDGSALGANGPHCDVRDGPHARVA